jgi:hypothetical protein
MHQKRMEAARRAPVPCLAEEVHVYALGEDRKAHHSQEEDVPNSVEECRRKGAQSHPDRDHRQRDHVLRLHSDVPAGAFEALRRMLVGTNISLSGMPIPQVRVRTDWKPAFATIRSSVFLV